MTFILWSPCCLAITQVKDMYLYTLRQVQNQRSNQTFPMLNAGSIGFCMAKKNVERQKGQTGKLGEGGEESQLLVYHDNITHSW